MPDEIKVDVSRIAQDLQIRKVHVENVVQLLDEGNTIPFITCYCKGETGGLPDEVLRLIQTRATLLKQLASRKQTMLKNIEKKGQMTDALREAIIQADTSRRVEDLFLPFKPRKRTPATHAKERGLEPVALAIWNRDPVIRHMDEVLPTLVDPDKGLKTTDAVKTGIRQILAEMVNETSEVRAAVRFVMWESGMITSIKNEKVRPERGKIYREFFKFEDSLRKISPQRIALMNRGEREGILKVKLEWDRARAQDHALHALSQFCFGQAEAGHLPVPSHPVHTPPPTPEPTASEPSPPPVSETETPAAQETAVPENNETSPEPPAVEPTPETPVADQPAREETAASEAAPASTPETPETPPEESSVSDGDAVATDENATTVAATTPPPQFTGLPPTPVANEGELLHHAAEFRTPHAEFLRTVLEEALHHLLYPGLEKEIRRELRDEAETFTIQGEARNLRGLLMGRPLHNKRILAIEPGFRHGCKLAALDEYGNLLDHTVIFPHPARKKKRPEKVKAVEPKSDASTAASTEKASDTTAADTATSSAPDESAAPATSETPATPEIATEPTAETTPENVTEQPVEATPENTTEQPTEVSVENAAEPTAEASSTPELVEETPTPSEVPSTSAPEEPPPAAPEEPLQESEPVATETPGDTAAPPPETPGEPAPAASEETSSTPSTEPAAAPETTKKIDETEDEDARKRAEAKTMLEEFVKKHRLSVIALGNGTASRATEGFLAEVISEHLPDLSYVIVNDAGAGVYAVSEIGKEEFPDADATLRSTVSLGRRLQDPLAELVKVDPASIGMNHQQPDVSSKNMREALEGIVESCVNAVGVDVNTAGVPLLRYVAGLNPLSANELVAYRKNNGTFKNREQLKQVPSIGEPRFVQAAGFLKIHDGDNPLDMTWIHPNSYALAGRVLEEIGCGVEVLKDGLNPEVQGKLKSLRVGDLAKKLEADEATLHDIIGALMRPGYDPREDEPLPVFRKGVLKFEDLQPGTEMRGTILNVVDFGVFVDIGLPDSGLVHISQIANRYVKSPSEVVSVGDVVSVWVMKVDAERQHVSLSMIPPGVEKMPREGRRDRDRPSRRRDRQERSDQAKSDQGRARGRSRPPRQGQPGRGDEKPTGKSWGSPGARGVSGDTRSRKPKRTGPPPKLSKDALAGREDLRSFGELSAFFAAKDEPKKSAPKPERRPETPPAASEPASETLTTKEPTVETPTPVADSHDATVPAPPSTDPVAESSETPVETAPTTEPMSPDEQPVENSSPEQAAPTAPDMEPPTPVMESPPSAPETEGEPATDTAEHTETPPSDPAPAEDSHHETESAPVAGNGSPDSHDESKKDVPAESTPVD